MTDQQSTGQQSTGQQSRLKDPLAGPGIYLWIWMMTGMVCLAVTPWALMLEGSGKFRDNVALMLGGIVLSVLAFLLASYLIYLLVRHFSGLVEFSAFGAMVHRGVFWFTSLLMVAYLGGLVFCMAMFVGKL